MSKTKAELLEEAKLRNLPVNEDNTVAEIKDALNNDQVEHVADRQDEEEVVVADNDNGEATNGTTEEGDESDVKNTESIPQNGVTEIKTTEPDNEVARKADEARTEEEVKFADESNPNQKARNATGEEEDLDGNERAGGKGYGVAANDPNVVPRKLNEGAGTAGFSSAPNFQNYENQPTVEGDFLHGETNNAEYTAEDQQELEEELSRPSDGVVARVITSAGDYVKVKFFLNGVVFGIYKSKKFDKAEANKFLDERLQAANDYKNNQ